MSGAEVAGLAFGVIPVILLAVKAYAGTGRIISDYRQYSSQLRRLQRRFDVQQQNFLNTCLLLLQLVVEDGHARKDMLENADHQFWTDEQTCAKLKKLLGARHNTCLNVMEEVVAVLDEFSAGFACYEVLLKDKEKGERVKDTIRRARKFVSIQYEKSQFEKQLQDLRELNSDLSLQLSHMNAFQDHRIPILPGSEPDGRLEQYRTIRTASKALHEALMTSWCCTDTEHTNHSAKLYLDARCSEETRVSLDMAISCQRSRHSAIDYATSAESTIWVYVQSSFFELLGGGAARASAVPQSLAFPPQHKVPKREEFGEPSSETPADISHRNAAKRRRAESGSSFLNDMAAPTFTRRRLMESSNAMTTELEAGQEAEPEAGADVDLRETGIICKHFQCTTCQIASLYHHRLGHLEYPRQCKHIFYCSGPRSTTSWHSSTAVSLADLLKNVPEYDFQIDHQLELAYRLSKSILQYHSTPWLNDEWHVDNLYVFGTPNDISESTLQSLHLNVSFLDDRDRGFSSALQNMRHNLNNRSAEPESGSTANILYGIRNMTLFSLGAALLQIGQWRTLQFGDRDDPVMTVRRWAARPMRLGPGYREIVRQCLECDFGYGNDICKPELQSAIYGRVISQLEEMMKKLSTHSI